MVKDCIFVPNLQQIAAWKVCHRRKCLVSSCNLFHFLVYKTIADCLVAYGLKVVYLKAILSKQLHLIFEDSEHRQSLLSSKIY